MSSITLRKAVDVRLTFNAPPSKSYTHRAYILASLADGESRVIRPLIARDTEITCTALRQLGAEIKPSGEDILVSGTSGSFPCREGTTLDMENSGTSLRLLTGVSLLCPTSVVITGNRRMQERPVGSLVTALNQLGGRISYTGRSGYPPVRTAGRLEGGHVEIPGDISSQFISSLLIAGPLAGSDVDITVTGEVASRSYIDLTLECMDAFGISPERDGYRHFLVKAGDLYKGREYLVEGDYSSSSYFFAVAALCGGSVRVNHLNPESVQGDREFLHALEMMGCKIKTGADYVEVRRTGELSGISIDMSSSPDTVQTLCMVAARASTPTHITGISHLRFKESDRISATADLLNGLGGDVRVTGDGLVITPSLLHGGTIDPADDHRTAMSAAVLALSRGDITIRDTGCVAKSFPGFWDELKWAGLW